MTVEPTGQEPPFVFVGGLHRSGTSLLARLIAGHPEACGLRGTGAYEDEGQWVQDVFPVARAWGGPGRFALHPDAHMTEDSPLLIPGARDRLLDAWGPYRDEERILVEKSPPNLTRLRFLQRLFPEARFVVLIRHPLAVSYATQKWARLPVHRLLDHWLAAHEIVADDAPAIRSLHVLRYEDLVTDPPAAMAAVFSFLGLDPRAADGDETPRRGVNEQYLARWDASGPLALRAPYRRWVSRRYEPRVRRFGYSLATGEPLGVPALPS